MILRKLHFVLLSASVGATACGIGPFDTTSCTTEVRPGIMVDVRDSVTNALVGRGSIIVAREGAVADTATGTSLGTGPYGLALERPGTYTLSVTQTGYQPWSKPGVVVTKGVCHVDGVAVTARLQK
jgi:hypothetical protein